MLSSTKLSHLLKSEGGYTNGLIKESQNLFCSMLDELVRFDIFLKDKSKQNIINQNLHFNVKDVSAKNTMNIIKRTGLNY